jgi:amino acid transporter
MGIAIVCLLLFIFYIITNDVIVKYYKKQKYKCRIYSAIYQFVIVIIGSIWLSLYIVYLYHKRYDNGAIIIIVYIAGVFHYMYKINDTIHSEYSKNRTLRVERSITKREQL